MSWQDDIEKAAREYAPEALTPAGVGLRDDMIRAFKAGASHALSRPLSEEDVVAIARDCTETPETYDELPPWAREILHGQVRLYCEALQRMRTKG
jgi:HD superfamily phosphohydrolase YqeK